MPTRTRSKLGPKQARGDERRVRSKHAQLNQDLMTAAKSGEGRQLCALVAARWKDFNAVNAATAYRSLLLMRTSRDHGQQQVAGQALHSAHEEVQDVLEQVLCEQHVQRFGARQCSNILHTLAKTRRQRPCENILGALEARALEVQGDFNPQNIANTLWAFATLGKQPDDRLVVGLTARAVEMQGDFNPQEIANTLWAFSTLGRQPNDELVAQLMARAVEVQGDFNPQDIANTLWALATLGRQPSDELVTGLTARVAEVQGDFNPQNIANTICALATLGRQPDDKLVVGLTAQAVQLQGDYKAQDIANTLWAFATLGLQIDNKLMVGLTTRAVEVQGGFNSQNIANTLWALATLGHQPDNKLVTGLTARVVEVQGDFNPQNIANMLWAFATLGIQPDDKLVAELTARAVEVQGDFSTQDIANTLWAVCFLSIRSPDVVSRLVHALELQILSVATTRVLDPQTQRQLHQFFVACNVDEGLRAGVPANILALRETVGPGFHAAFVEQVTQASRSQQQVSEALRDMRLLVQDEAECLRSGYSFDMRVYNTSVLGQSIEDSRRRAVDGWVVEFDGPSHFLACRTPTGATLIKQHQLRLLGYTLVSLPYWEWDRLDMGVGKQQKQYLWDKLQLALSIRALEASK